MKNMRHRGDNVLLRERIGYLIDIIHIYYILRIFTTVFFILND